MDLLASGFPSVLSRANAARARVCVAAILRIAAGLLASAWLAPAWSAPAEPLLTRAAEVLSLTEQQADRELPVRLRGVVIGDAPPVGKAFVLWDESGYVYVRKPAPEGEAFQRGDLVELDGTTSAGGFAPLVYMSSGRKLGVGPLPAPRDLGYEQLLAGEFDAQWVRVRGIVRRCESSEAWAGRWRLALATGNLLLAVHVNSDQSPKSLIDAEVALDGVLFNQHNVSRQFVRAVLFVPEGVPIAIEKPAPADPFAAPLRPVGRLLQFERQERYGHRVHVRGQVLHQLSGGWIWIRDGEHGLRVATPQGERLTPGDEVDVLGFAVLGGYKPRLEDAVFRKTRPGRVPTPATPADMRAAIAHESDLVSIEAELVEVRRTADGVSLALNWRDSRVTASFPLPDGNPVPSGWIQRSVVRITGICTVPATEPAPASGRWEPQSFDVLLRSPADLAVLQPAPWWTHRRILWALAGVAGLSLMAGAGVLLISRRRLREQAIRRTQAEAEFAAILAERSRLAREIHDTLAQGLAAVSMQLELGRSAGDGDQGTVQRHLDAAHQLVRGSLADARASIWNMRAQVLETHDLAGALESVLRQLTDDTQVEARFRVTGCRRRLAPVVENELLRIGQEAVVNAMKHAKPQHLEVSLAFSEQHVELTVIDDGAGFAPERAASRSGSYGIAGMRERAAQLHAEMTLDSAPARGTRLVLRVPTPT